MKKTQDVSPKLDSSSCVLCEEAAAEDICFPPNPNSHSTSLLHCPNRRTGVFIYSCIYVQPQILLKKETHKGQLNNLKLTETNETGLDKNNGAPIKD